MRTGKIVSVLPVLSIAGVFAFAAPRPATAQCPITYETCGFFVELMFCEGCPGFSACLCLYQGAQCPSATISCLQFEMFEPHDRGYIVVMWETHCYIYKGCRSKKGGPCGVFPWGTNPCVDYGDWQPGGHMWDVDVLENCPCG